MKSIRSPMATTPNATNLNNGKGGEQSPIRLANNTKRNSSVKKSLRRQDEAPNNNITETETATGGIFTSPRIQHNQDSKVTQQPSISTPGSTCSEGVQSEHCPSSVTSSVYMKYSNEPESLINLLAAKKATTSANNLLNKLSPRSTISSIRDSHTNVQQMSKVYHFFLSLIIKLLIVFFPLTTISSYCKINGWRHK